MRAMQFASISMADYRELKELYETAVEYNQESFVFLDKPVLTGYAKYLIQYIELQIDRGVF